MGFFGRKVCFEADRCRAKTLPLKKWGHRMKGILSKWSHRYSHFQGKGTFWCCCSNSQKNVFESPRSILPCIGGSWSLSSRITVFFNWAGARRSGFFDRWWAGAGSKGSSGCRSSRVLRAGCEAEWPEKYYLFILFNLI